MNPKTKILLCWWYDRRDLIEPFLQMQDEIEFNVLFYRFREEESLSFGLPFKRLYWTDYSSPYKLLKESKPNLIVFMGIENLLTIALNIAAHNKKIPTVYVAHGISYSLSDAIKSADSSTQTIERYKIDNPIYHRKKWHSVDFFLNSILIRNVAILPFFIRYIYATYRFSDIHSRLKNCKSKYRQADKYILFAPAYKRLFTERDGVQSDKFSYVGPYPMDSLFLDLKSASNQTSGNYWLFIDQPLSTLNWESRFRVFRQIGKQAVSQGNELKVKLHPMDYERINLNNLDGITFVKNEIQLVDLIKGANLCIGFYSALLLPVIVFKKVLVIDPQNLNLLTDWRRTESVYYTSFSDLLTGKFDWSSLEGELNKASFIGEFVFQVNGQGNDLLKKKLTSTEDH